MRRLKPRIVVTGIGAVSAYGWGADTLWQGLDSGTTAIGAMAPIEGASFTRELAAQVPAPPAGNGYGEAASSAERFGLAATLEAVEQSGLPREALESACLFFSTSTSGMLEAERFYVRRAGAAPGPSELNMVAGQPLSCPAERIAHRLGITGEVQTVSSACAAGALAIGLACDALRAGVGTVALAGGADSLCLTTYGGFTALESLSPDPSLPFRRERSGLSLGEGAAVLVLETLDSAAARGARALAEVSGSAATADAYHMTAPDPDGGGAARALREALEDAGVKPSDVGFVCAHGTGTDLNDRAESLALSAAFGPALERLPITATKASVGHLLGSAGALEAVATVLMLIHQRVHPTPAVGTTDPDLGLDLVLGVPREIGTPAVGVSLNLAFGGCNGALVFSSFGAGEPRP